MCALIGVLIRMKLYEFKGKDRQNCNLFVYSAVHQENRFFKTMTHHCCKQIAYLKRSVTCMITMGYEHFCICNIYQVNQILSPSVAALLISHPTLFVVFCQQVLTNTLAKYSINAKSPNGSWETNFYLLRKKRRRSNKMKVYSNWIT